MDESPEKVAVYRGKRAALEGRAMFVNINTDEASPAAAYLTLKNDPIAQKDRIAAAVKAGFMVRTRADADTWAAQAQRRPPAHGRPDQRRAVRLDPTTSGPTRAFPAAATACG
ncbi:Ca2+-dependent phosphoinositide-specific phospholipase C [Caulobacter segnis]